MSESNLLDLSINENNLLQEWQGQASLMFEFGIQLADARQEEDEARAALAVTAAELDREIRSAPGDYGVQKVTESTIQAAVCEQPEHTAATQKWIKAKHTTRILQAAVDALNHRKASLQGMTTLWLQQWHADPTSTSQPSELRKAAKTTKIPGRRKRRSR